MTTKYLNKTENYVVTRISIVQTKASNESASSSSARLSNLSSVNVNATTPVARGNVFLERQSQKQDFVKDMTATAVPIWHPGQEKFKFGRCKYCEKLSLQPHLNRTGQHNKGKLLLRCSSWFRREQGFQDFQKNCTLGGQICSPPVR